MPESAFGAFSRSCVSRCDIHKERHVVHRDDTVEYYAQREGVIKLADFGLAKQRRHAVDPRVGGGNRAVPVPRDH